MFSLKKKINSLSHLVDVSCSACGVLGIPIVLTRDEKVHPKCKEVSNISAEDILVSREDYPQFYLAQEFLLSSASQSCVHCVVQLSCRQQRIFRCSVYC
jgi:hypothetical protein